MPSKWKLEDFELDATELSAAMDRLAEPKDCSIGTKRFLAVSSLSKLLVKPMEALMAPDLAGIKCCLISEALSDAEARDYVCSIGDGDGSDADRITVEVMARLGIRLRPGVDVTDGE